MQKIKTLFHQTNDVNPNIQALCPDVNLVSEVSNSVEFPDEHHSEALPIPVSDLPSSSKRRKTPEEIIKHKYEYQREYLKKWRAKKKRDEESMKTINQLAMNALIKVLNANSHLIAEEDMNIINDTIDYNDRCTKIIKLINELYEATT